VPDITDGADKLARFSPVAVMARKIVAEWLKGRKKKPKGKP
jgi:hypothetical protein